MELKQTREFILKNYSRRYAVTLSFTDRNIDEALEVYKLGVENALGITEAVTAKYGYRYRRMENFLRECKLWKEEKGWLHWRVETKLYFEYEEAEFVSVDLFLKHLAPEWLIGDHDIGECEGVMWDLLTSLGYEWMLYVLAEGEFSVGDDRKIEEVDYMLDCSQDAEYTLVLWKRGRIVSTESGTFELDNYRLYGVFIC